MIQYLGRAWVAQAKTHPSGPQEVAGSIGLTWSQAAPSHTVYHCPVAPPGSAPARRDCSWEKLLTGYPLSTAAEINLLGGVAGGEADPLLSTKPRHHHER